MTCEKSDVTMLTTCLNVIYNNQIIRIVFNWPRTYSPIMEVIPILWKEWNCTIYMCLWYCLYGRVLFQYSGLQSKCKGLYLRLDWISFSTRFFNETLSPVWYTWDYLQPIFFWLPLFINTYSPCMINHQLASWLILRIVFLPNSSFEGVYCI